VRFMEIPCNILRRKNTGAMSTQLVSSMTYVLLYAIVKSCHGFHSVFCKLWLGHSKARGFDMKNRIVPCSFLQ
jgi:hypothetical protein